MLLDEAVAQFFQRASSHLANRDRKKLPQGLFDRVLDDLYLFRRASMQQRVLERDLFHWGKTDGTLALQIQQEPPADHVLGLAVWLGPVPR